MIINTRAAVTLCLWLFCCLQQVASRSLAPGGDRFCLVGEDSVKKRSVSESETFLSRHKRFLTLVKTPNPPQPGVNAWNIADDGPVKVGWSSLLPPTDVLTMASQEEVIVSCLRKWAEPSGLVFTYLGGPVTEQDANILISFTPLNLPEFVLANAESPRPFATPPVSTIQFDSTKGPFMPFGDSNAPADMFFLSLEELVCHEIGHSLNLDHPNRQDLNVMNPVLPNAQTRVALSADDTAGIQFIYGQANGMTLTGGVSITPAPTVPPTPTVAPIVPSTPTVPSTVLSTPTVPSTVPSTPTVPSTVPSTPTVATTPATATTTRPTTTTPPPTTTTTPRPTTTTTPRPTTTTTPRPTTTTPNYPWRGLAQRLTGPVAARTPRPPSTTQRVTVATTRMTASPTTRGLVTAPPAPTNPPTAPTPRPATPRPTTRRPATRRPTNRRPGNGRNRNGGNRNGRNRNRRPVNRGRNRGGGSNQNCRRPNGSIKAKCLRRG